MSQVVGNEGVVNPNSVAAQGQSQQTAATSVQDDPSYQSDIYKGQLDEMLTTVATGETSDNIIKVKSKGQEDNPKKIKMAIEREFWRNTQVVGVWILGFALGSIVLLLIFTSSDEVILKVKQPKPEVEVEGTEEPEELPDKFKLEETYNLFSRRGLYKKLGMLFLGFFIATLIGQRIPHGIKKCKGSRKKPVAGVDPDFFGAQCLNDGDCTISSEEIRDVCVERQVGALGRAFKVLGYLSVFPAGFILGFGDDTEEATSIDYVASFFLGFSGGYILNYYISH